MSKLNETVMSVEYDGLIVDANPPADVFAVKIKAGEGLLKRGTVLTSQGNDGVRIVLGASSGAGEVGGASESTSIANCILAEDTDATEETNALAYRMGHFAANRLIVKEGYELTEADKEALRDVGILLSDAMEY